MTQWNPRSLPLPMKSLSLMATGAAHRSPSVGRRSCCRLIRLSIRRALITLPHHPIPTRSSSMRSTSKSLFLLDIPSRLDLSYRVVRFMGDSTFPSTIIECEGDPWWTPLRYLYRVLIAAMASGFSWITTMLVPEESSAASGGRMGGRTFSSKSSSGSGNSSSRSSLGSSTHNSRSDGSGSRGTAWSETSSTIYSPAANRPYTVHQESGFSNSGFRRIDQETEFVATVTPANHLSAPTIVHSWTSHLSFLIFACIFGASTFSNLRVRNASTILKLQVGLLGSARSLQESLDRVANNADPSTKYGLHNILTETVLALLRHSGYFSFGFSKVDIQRNIEHCEEKFNWFSTEERAKINEETLVNTGDTRSQTKSRQESDGFCNEYIVVTILMAAEGKHELLVVKDRDDVNEALKTLASISASKILALEVLWTPQDKNDTLTAQDLMLNYSFLRPL